MAELNRLTIRICGENGQGLSSMGELIARALKREGAFTYSYREYPSLIMGGHAFHQIEVSGRPVSASSRGCDLLIGLSRVSVHHYFRDLRPGGRLINGVPRMDWRPDEKAWLEQNRIQEEFIDSEKIAIETGGKRIMSNTVLVGTLWQILGLSSETLQTVLRQVFADKPKVLDGNIACLEKGRQLPLEKIQPIAWPYPHTENNKDDAVVPGNQLLVMGAVAAGVRAYYAYPMTPSSTILTYFAEIAKENNILVKQIDDEISVAQMAIGSMFMGTRALVGTSGGGFDLMSESFSLAGMTETPFVCVLAQRPGPATGLPTWTCAADLNLAIYAGHGEYARCVLALSDAASAYTLVQSALNIAEKFQIPVVLLTEKNIGESLFQVDRLPDNLPIERGLVSEDQLAGLQKTDRYKVTDSGVSPRWLPRSADATYDANSDEHLEDGTLTEEAEPTRQMYAKRLRKLDSLAATLPEPVLYGPVEADISFVGWGSTKNTILDAQTILAETGGPKINYLHYEYLWPLKTETFRTFASRAKRLVLIENNAFGQLGALLTQETQIPFWEKLLKYDGRPFFVEDILDFVAKGAP